jgi:transcriptional regulator with XRE-family HTH domain
MPNIYTNIVLYDIILKERRGIKLEENAVGELIKTYRKLRGMNQITLGDLSETSQGYISDLENGKIDSPKLGTIKKLAKTLGIPDEKIVEAMSKLEPDFEVLKNYEDNRSEDRASEESLKSRTKAIARKVDALPEAKLDEVENYLDYLIEQHKKKGNK